MSVQEEYREDMTTYAEQVERARILSDVRMRGLNTIEDDIIVAHFSYKGEVYKIYVYRGQEINTEIVKKVREIENDQAENSEEHF